MFIHSFYQICQKFSNNIAIKEGNKQLSYQELLQKTKDLSCEILQIDTNKPIGIYIEKSSDFVIAILAVWWSGKAFFPLSKELSQERIDFILEETACELILTNEEKLLNIPFLNLQTITSKTQKDNLPIYQLTDLAYLFFTSGSTGKPKGVMLSHQGLERVLKAQIKVFELDEKSQSLWYLSQLFDASLSDIGTALLSGACLHILPKNYLLDLSYFYNYLQKEQITYIDIPPTILASLDIEKVSNSLKTIVIGGEACLTKVINQWCEKVRLINVYGPTEATICTSYFHCQNDENSIYYTTIGKPFAENHYHILDGELYIGGENLAIAYLNNPELTNEKFVVIDGKRMYKTGDAVTQDEFGDYHFLHRIDRQFKINGKLVEPYEIEKIMLSHLSVEQVAIIHKKAENRSLLIAFLVVNSTYQEQEIRAFVHQKLPAWMRPHQYILVDDFPKNQHHKIDYQALQNHSLVIKNTLDEQVNDKEIYVLKEIWEEVLQQKNISITANFYQLGGDSLALMQILAKAHAKGLKLTPENLYHNQNIVSQVLGQEKYTHAKSVNVLLDIAHQLKKELTFPQKEQNISKRKRILLTGTTGFLGSNLLIAILQKESKDLEIFCLLRGKTVEEAKKRLIKKLEKHHDYQAHFEEKIQVILGDIAQENWGMSISDWEYYTQKITHIYHCAAVVNMMKTFEELYASNVLSSLYLINFINQGIQKKVHYASTLSVFVGTNQNEGTFYESDLITNSTLVYGGYAQTKWLSEYLLSEYSPSKIYRFGLLTGDSKRGEGIKNDYLGMFLKALSVVKSVPKITLDLQVDITPIDLASAYFYQLSQQNSFRFFHIANQQGTSVKELIAIFEEIEIVSTEEFYQKIANFPQEGAILKLAFCKKLADENDYLENHTFNLFQASNTKFDCQNAKKIIDYQLNGLDSDLLKKYFNFYLS